MALDSTEEFLYVPAAEELPDADHLPDAPPALDFGHDGQAQEPAPDLPNPAAKEIKDANEGDGEQGEPAGDEDEHAESPQENAEEKEREDEKDEDGEDEEDEEDEDDEESDAKPLYRNHLGYPDIPFSPDDVTIVDLIRGHVAVNCRGHEVQIPVLMSLMMMSIIAMSPATFFVSIGVGFPLVWVVHSGLNWLSRDW